MKILKNSNSHLKSALKNIYETCATSPQNNFFKTLKILSFFQKRGVKGVKNDFFEKIFPKLKRASKIGY